MLYILQSLTDKFVNYLEQDPVRPNIPIEKRLGNNKDIFMLIDNEEVKAITCVSYQQQIPNNETALFDALDPEVVVFYTIWSYQPGSGRQLIYDTVKHIQHTKPYIKRFVTLSPKTEMARKFHLKNGALVYKENIDTVNYEYVLATA